MTQTQLSDGTPVFCLQKGEAIVLDHHVQGYLDHGISPQRGQVIFDVGANIGLFGVRAWQRCGGDVRVYAFEPVPPTFEVLAKNFAAFDGARLRALPVGLSRAPGQVEFSYFPNSPALSTAHKEDWDEEPGRLAAAVRSNFKNPPPGYGWARWVPGFAASWIARFLRAGEVRFPCTLKTVSQVMREEGLDRIDLLKIDCEGAELAVLEGVEEADWPRIHQVVAEVNDRQGRLDAVRTLLTARGFDQLTVAEEEGMEGTGLVNVYARRGAAPAGDAGQGGA